MKSNSVFKTPILFLRQHDAGVENISDMKAAGFAGVFCNIGDPASPPEAWFTIRNRCANEGMFCGPWLRTTDESGVFSWNRFTWLLQIADSWNPTSGIVIVNSESELQGTQDIITKPMRSTLGNRDAAVCMEPQPFDNVHWYPLSDIPILAQFSTTTRTDVIAMRDLWHAYGIECMFPTYGSFGGAKPSDYELKAPYSIYTADDCGLNYAVWGPIAGTFEGCIKVEPEVKVSGVKTEVDKAWGFFRTATVPDKWEEQNQGEFTKIKTYYETTTPVNPPTGIVSEFGKGLLALVEAGKWADGTHI